MATEIKVCMGSACFARGNAENLEFIEKFLKDNNMEANVEIVGSRCEGYCADGPNIYVDGQQYKNMNEEKIEALLKGLL